MIETLCALGFTVGFSFNGADFVVTAVCEGNGEEFVSQNPNPELALQNIYLEVESELEMEELI